MTVTMLEQAPVYFLKCRDFAILPYLKQTSNRS